MLLACAVCKGPLVESREHAGLSCAQDKMHCPIHDGVPALLRSEGRRAAGETNQRNGSLLEPCAD
jgi:uncharacterized protein YbaR (Trm112 family)